MKQSSGSDRTARAEWSDGGNGSADHPRPQLRWAGWRDLSGAWGFAFDDAGVGMLEKWQDRADVYDRVLRVPFPFESGASGIGDTGFHSVVCGTAS